MLQLLYQGVVKLLSVVYQYHISFCKLLSETLDMWSSCFWFFGLDVSSFVLRDSPSCVSLWHSSFLLFTCSVFEAVCLPYSLSACLFSVWCWFVCVCSSCVVFFQLLSSATVWFALSFVFCFVCFFVLDSLLSNFWLPVFFFVVCFLSVYQFIFRALWMLCL